MINNFIDVDACVKFPYLGELCCYPKYVSMKRYVLKNAQSIYGIIFDKYGINILIKGHNDG